MPASLICIIVTLFAASLAQQPAEPQIEIIGSDQPPAPKLYAQVIGHGQGQPQQQPHQVKLLPKSYPIQGIPIERFDYFDATNQDGQGNGVGGLVEEINIAEVYRSQDQQQNQYYRKQTENSYMERTHATYSMWTEWSFCSRSCGGGVSMRSRVCLSNTNPEECTDEHLFQYMICNIEACQDGEEDYRAIQCAEYNGTKQFGGAKIQKFSWLPYYGKDENSSPCELRCVMKGYSYVKGFGPAKDGTRCSRGTQRSYSDMCVSGKCMRVGCDRILGSDRTEDSCGVCGGDNSSCRHIQLPNFNRTANLVTADYNEIEMIPKGATNIRVVESTENILALMEANGQYINYVINGNWVLNYPGEIPAAGTMVRYEKKNDVESFFVHGPTKTDLYVMMLYLGGSTNISIEYWLSNSEMSQRRLEYIQRYKIVPNRAFRTMPFIAPYSPPVTTPVPPPQVVPIVSSNVRTTQRPRTTTTTTTTPLPVRYPYQHRQQHRQRQQRQRHRHNNSNSSKYHRPPVVKVAKTAPASASVITQHRGTGEKPPYCTPCKKTVGRKRHFCDSDFVIHVQILSRSRAEGKRYRHDVLVRKVYKSGFKLMRREYVWVYSSCCPKLRRGRQYLVMGRKRRIRFAPGARGSWIAPDATGAEDDDDEAQYQTRLVLDYLDYWRGWRGRYDQKLANIARDPSACAAAPVNSTTTMTQQQRRHRHQRQQTIGRDPEKRWAV